MVFTLRKSDWQKPGAIWVTNVTALPATFAQQLAQGERRDLFITSSLQPGESETVIYAVGIAGFPLKLEDGLLMLQFMECLSTDFSWQMAPAINFLLIGLNSLGLSFVGLGYSHGQRAPLSHMWNKSNKSFALCPLETELLSPLQMPVTSLYH